MMDVLIVPGLHGSGDQHWQRIWLEEFPEAILVDQEDWSNPHRENWLANLEQAISFHPGALLVAHSLGSILVANLSDRPAGQLVAGALLVAPADITRTESLHARTYEFGDMPTEPLPFPTIVAASHNDPYMPFDKTVAAAGHWGSRLVDLGDAGHVNIQSGYGRWPQGYSLAHSIG